MKCLSQKNQKEYIISRNNYKNFKKKKRKVFKEYKKKRENRKLEKKALHLSANLKNFTQSQPDKQKIETNKSSLKLKNNLTDIINIMNKWFNMHTDADCNKLKNAEFLLYDLLYDKFPISQSLYFLDIGNFFQKQRRQRRQRRQQGRKNDNLWSTIHSRMFLIRFIYKLRHLIPDNIKLFQRLANIFYIVGSIITFSYMVKDYARKRLNPQRKNRGKIRGRQAYYRKKLKDYSRQYEDFYKINYKEKTSKWRLFVLVKKYFIESRKRMYNPENGALYFKTMHRFSKMKKIDFSHVSEK